MDATGSSRNQSESWNDSGVRFRQRNRPIALGRVIRRGLKGGESHHGQREHENKGYCTGESADAVLSVIKHLRLLSGVTTELVSRSSHYGAGKALQNTRAVPVCHGPPVIIMARADSAKES